MTPEERALLPRYCMFTQDFDRARHLPGHYNDYLKRHGKSWSHLHHFCWALGSMLRYANPANSARQRKFFSQKAINDIDYVLKRSEPSFVLWFTIRTKKARILLLEQEFEPAMRIAEDLVEKYPDRADAHGLLAEVHYSGGNKRLARETLENAKQIVKDSKRLAAIAELFK